MAFAQFALLPLSLGRWCWFNELLARRFALEARLEVQWACNPSFITHAEPVAGLVCFSAAFASYACPCALFAQVGLAELLVGETSWTFAYE